jgi:hypothetical protein
MKIPTPIRIIALALIWFYAGYVVHRATTSKAPSISETDIRGIIDNATWTGTKFWPNVDTTFLAINGQDTVAYVVYWHPGAAPGAPPDSSRLYYWSPDDLQAIDEGINGQ